METIRVATWNIGSLYSDYPRNIAYVETILSEQKVDILCMQEVPNQADLLENIRSWGGFNHWVFHITSASHVCKESEMGIAVFSRFDLSLLEILPLPKPMVAVSYNGVPEAWHDKYFMAVSCRTEQAKVVVVTGHGFPFHRYGLENPANFHIIDPTFRDLDCWLMSVPDRFAMPLLCVAGDFNLLEPLLFLHETAGCYQDVFDHEATRPSGRKTDAILIDKSGGVHLEEKFNICPPRQNGRAELDHNFIMAELSLQSWRQRYK